MTEKRSLRERAERYLDEHGRDGSWAPTDPRQLVHELQVYQAELEIQNEELQTAKALADESRDYYLKLFQSAPVGYLEVDGRGVVVEVNETFLAMSKAAHRPAVLGRAVALLVADEDRTLLQEHLQIVRRAGRSTACDVRVLVGDAPPCWCRVEMVPWGRGQDRVLTSWTDVSGAVADRERIAQLNSLLYAVRQIHTLLVSERDEHALAKGVADALTSASAVYGAWVGFHWTGLDSDEFLVTGCSDPKMSRGSTGGAPPECFQVAREHGGQWVEVPSAKRCPACRANGSTNTVALAIAVTRHERVLGTVCVSASRQLADDEETRAVFAELAEDLGAALHARNLERERVEDRRQLEAANASLRTLEEIVNRSPAVGFRWRLEPGWPVEYVSDSVRAFGYEPEQLLGGELLFAQMVHPEDRERVGEEVEGYLAEGRSEFTQEYRLVTAGGEIRWVDDRTWVEREAGGGARAALGILLDITDRRHAEAALATSEERLRIVFETIPDAVTLTRLSDGRYLDVNRSFAQLTGAAGAAVQGQSAIELDHWADPEDRQYLVQQLEAHGEVRNLAARFRLPAGEMFGLVSARSLSLDGEPYILAITRDVTELEAARQRLDVSRRVEERIAELLRAVLAGVTVEEAAVQVLAAARELTGSRFGYVGYIDSDTGYLVCPTMTHDIWDQCGVAGKSIVFEQFGGLWGWVLDHREPLLCNEPSTDDRSSGTPTGHLPIERFLSAPSLVGDELVGQVALANREQPYTEEHLEVVQRLAAIWAVALDRLRAESSLADSERRYRQLFEELRAGAAVGEILSDGNGAAVDFVLLEVNKAFEQQTGMPREETIGRPMRQLLPHLGADLVSFYARVVDTGEPNLVTVWMEDLGRWYEAGAYRPSPGRFAILFEDVSARVEAERERQRLEAQMLQAQKLESLGVLAGGIAHDFNNLLMGVLGNADLAQMHLPPTGAATDKIERIRTSAQRAAELCRQMLAYSGKGRFVVGPVDLNEVVHEIGELLRASVAKHVTLVYSLAPSLSMVDADVAQLRQLLMNLVTNASEAIEGESGSVVVTTSESWCDRDCLQGMLLDESLPEGPYVSLEVADDGCGMDAETVERIFDPFFSTKFTGRGLGLAAVLGIVRGHRGAIRVDSEPGRGTTVTLRLPVSVPAEVPSTERLSSRPSESTGTVMVLVVDDEPAVRDVASSMLEALGFEVVTAEDGRTAVEYFRKHHDEIDCVLLDLTMPELDGEATFKQLCQVDQSVCVVLSSGHNENEAMARFSDAGLAGFIQKPYRLRALRDIMTEVLHGENVGHGTAPERR